MYSRRYPPHPPYKPKVHSNYIVFALIVTSQHTGTAINSAQTKPSLSESSTNACCVMCTHIRGDTTTQV